MGGIALTIFGLAVATTGASYRSPLIGTLTAIVGVICAFVGL